MHYRFCHLLLMLLPLAFIACSSVPAAQDSEHISAAKRFLRSFDAGEIALTALQSTLEHEFKEQPAMADLSRRIFADTTAMDFEDLCARTYARHLTQDHLVDLARFTETKTGKRFFRIAIDSALYGKPIDPKEMMRQFNVDELTEILRFSQSESLSAMKNALPTINRELAEEGNKWVQDKLREYLSRQELL